MSLFINPKAVVEVLLTDGWHDVEPGSFDLDSYEFGYEYGEGRLATILGGGQADGVCATGFAFEAKTGQTIYGPLTSILAVRCEATS